MPQEPPVQGNIVLPGTRQTQNELFMFEVGGFGGSEAISLETGKSRKTDKRMYLTSEYISMTKELTVTWDKPGFQYDKVEECIKMCLFFLVPCLC